MPVQVFSDQVPDYLAWQACPQQPGLEYARLGSRRYVRRIATPYKITVFSMNELEDFAKRLEAGTFQL